jgi:hypothetical protein
MLIKSNRTTENNAAKAAPSGDRTITVLFVAATAVAMIGWLYALGRCAIALGVWMFG